jgi:4-amino-4-deoxy-L-arabinose transferase-like glycosyltransferase
VSASFRRWLGDAPLPKDAWFPFFVGVLVRGLTVLWGGTRFPPVEDGRFYDVLARRIAEGHGYTWLWPDGVVTPVAHYPVGYPALIAGVYRLLGPHPWAAMILNAALGSLAVIAVHRIARSVGGRGSAVLGALAFALHPALVLYTPALMTEGIAASFVILAGALAVEARERTGRALWVVLALLGVTLGVAVLVRGQLALVIPFFAWIATKSSIRRGLGVCGIAAATVLPWTLRNSARMDAPVVVSANLGWNLLIGATPGANGTFVPIAGDSVPVECRTVFGEASKDACFARAALHMIRERPFRWLALVPKKLTYTFEYAGAAGWYLNVANPNAFGESKKLTLGVVETAWQRILVLAALVALCRVPGPRRRVRVAVGFLSALALFGPLAWVSHLGLCALGLSLGRDLGRYPPAALAVVVTGATIVTHAVFFGAGRYGLPVFPSIAALAGMLVLARFDTEAGDG